MKTYTKVFLILAMYCLPFILINLVSFLTAGLVDVEFVVSNRGFWYFSSVYWFIFTMMGLPIIVTR